MAMVLRTAVRTNARVSRLLTNCIESMNAACETVLFDSYRFNKTIYQETEIQNSEHLLILCYRLFTNAFVLDYSSDILHAAIQSFFSHRCCKKLDHYSVTAVPIPNVHLEAMEEAQNKGGQFAKAGNTSRQGLPIWTCTITNEKLAQAGYFDFPAYYEFVRKMHLCG